MSDHNEDWWNAPGTDSPPQPENPDAPRQDDAGVAASANEAPLADQPPPADATTVLPSSPAGTPPSDHGQQPAQQPPGAAPQPPPPPPAPQPAPPQAYSQPPAYGGQQPFAPQYGNQPQPPPQAYGQPPGQHPYTGPQYGQIPGASGPTSRKRTGGVIAGALMMLGGAFLACLGTVLPWVSFDGFGGGDPPNGFETYPFFADDFDPVLWTNPGAYVLGAYALLAVVAIIVLAAGKATWSSVCGILVSLVGAAISLAAIAAIADLVNTFRDLDVGAGVVLIGLAAVVAFIGSLITAIVR